MIESDDVIDVPDTTLMVVADAAEAAASVPSKTIGATPM
jgi:hypothetical protein